MKKTIYSGIFIRLVVLAFIALGTTLHAQPLRHAQPVQGDQQISSAVHPTLVAKGTFLGISRPLRDIPALSATELKEMNKENSKLRLNEALNSRSYPYAATALPSGVDGAWQKQMGTNRVSGGPIVNFDGQSTTSFPPDDNGTVGPGHYMQTMNSIYAIYDKSGNLMAGPTPLNEIFGNVPGADRNDGDPIILYDEQADRWLVTEFSVPANSQNYILIAVSTTNNPAGTWYQYSFPADKMPDYPKFGVWRDGYYMADNNDSGTNDIYVYERTPMLSGETAQVVGFKNPYRPVANGFMCVPPLDNDGAFAPEGSPGLYIAFKDDATAGGIDQLWIYELDVDWNAIASSTFNRVQQINVEPFNSNFGPTWENIRQKDTEQKVDAVPSIVMNMPQYRNFGSYQTIVCCHTVNVDGKGHAGIRWYELRKTGADWTVRQQSTYAPDSNSRWMGCILLNSKNTIGLAYSISSLGEYPGIRYCGQSPEAYLVGNSVLDIAEDTIFVGVASQTDAERWGDYSSLSIDPSDDETFWYTNQYEGDSCRMTKIASFKLSGPVGVPIIKNEGADRVRIYPNPTNGIFRIVPEDNSGTPLDVAVEDQTGKIISRKQFSGNKEYVMDITNFPCGVYYLLITFKDWKVTSKLVLVP